MKKTNATKPQGVIELLEPRTLFSAAIHPQIGVPQLVHAVVGEYGNLGPLGTVQIATIPGNEFKELKATIHWGNHKVSQGEFENTGGNTLIVIGDNEYAHAGSYPVVATIERAIQTSGYTTTIWSAPIAVIHTRAVAQLNSTNGRTVHTIANHSFSGELGIYAGQLSAPAPGAYEGVTFDIDWGDGTTSTGTFASIDANSTSLQGTHTYAKRGTYRIGLDIIDGPIGTLPPGVVVTDIVVPLDIVIDTAIVRG